MFYPHTTLTIAAVRTEQYPIHVTTIWFTIPNATGPTMRLVAYRNVTKEGLRGHVTDACVSEQYVM